MVDWFNEGIVTCSPLAGTFIEIIIITFIFIEIKVMIDDV